MSTLYHTASIILYHPLVYQPISM